MRTITFTNIHILGHIIHESSAYKHIHFPEMLNRYNSNFIEIKHMPNLTTFKEIEQQLKDYHQQHGQQHLKFIFPANEKISKDIEVYLKGQSYDIGFLELYTIQPKDFHAEKSTAIDVQFVSVQTASDFMQLQYNEDLRYGESFAKQKQFLLAQLFKEKKHHQILAYFNDVPAGSVELIECEDTVEIDNLFVIEAMQRKGLGSQIQRFVMENFPDKTVILVADGDDTAKDMYHKQGYAYQGYQYEALKIIKA